jgi:WASH complex subunit strumpellin
MYEQNNAEAGEAGENKDEGSSLTKEQMALKEEAEEEANKAMREFLKDVTTCVEYIGLVKPMNKVYSLSRDLHHMPLMFALVTLNALQYLQYDTHLYSLVRGRREVVLDGPHFIVGLLTIFRQYHTSNFLKYLNYLGNYLKNVIQASHYSPQGLRQLPPEASPTLCFLEELMRFEGKSRDVISQILGPYIFDYFLYH